MAEHSAEALRYNGDHPLGGVYHALALWELGRTEEAQQEITLLIQKDPLHHLARYAAVLCGVMPADEFYAALHSDPAQTALDVYFDLAQAGFSEAGKAMLRGIAEPNLEICLLLGECHEAEPMAPAHAYPSRIEEYELLRQTTEEHPEFAEAQYRFGCLLYSKRQYERAADCFRRAVEEQPAMYAAYRNLAVAYYSHLNRREEALPLLEKALSLAPQEEQLVLETAYVRAKLGLPPEETAAFIRNHSMEMSRDDLFVELARAYNLAGQYEQALDVLHGHTFVPCEGGEHAVADQYMFAQHGIGRKLLAAGHLTRAGKIFRAAKICHKIWAPGWNEVKLIPHEFYEAQS
ncbi:MAG: tetratricopeptide repeat protein [Bianqueaceae bacterium]